MLYDPKLSSNSGILTCINRNPKKRKFDEVGGMVQSDLIFNPTEILDERQKEWETANPEMAARDPERQVYMKPEFYEEEMQKIRDRKAV